MQLSGSGAQIRCLIPFGKLVVDGWEEAVGPEAFAARAAMRHLSRYFFLSGDMQPHDDSLLDNALAFHTVWWGCMDAMLVGGS